MVIIGTGGSLATPTLFTNLHPSFFYHFIWLDCAYFSLFVPFYCECSGKCVYIQSVSKSRVRSVFRTRLTWCQCASVRLILTHTHTHTRWEEAVLPPQQGWTHFSSLSSPSSPLRHFNPSSRLRGYIRARTEKKYLFGLLFISLETLCFRLFWGSSAVFLESRGGDGVWKFFTNQHKQQQQQPCRWETDKRFVHETVFKQRVRDKRKDQDMRFKKSS